MPKDMCFAPVDHLRWLFFDLNSYFASIEQHERPELQGRPVAVVPMMTDATCAIAASYEAKRHGIRTGTKIHEAKRLCPDLVCVQARHDVYVDYHHRIMQVLEDHIHIHKIWSIDEAACKLTGYECHPEQARALARQIQFSLQDRIGPSLKCSIGIAPNSFLAKIASDMQKPNGLTILMPDQLKGQLSRLELMDLPGINFNMRRRLYRGGIYSVADIWNASPKQMRAIWRSVEGERFWYRLRGYDIPEQVSKKSVIGHSRILDPELRAPERAYPFLRYLTTKAASRLRRYNMYAGKLAISVRFMDKTRWGAERSFSPAQDNHRLLDAVEALWFPMMQAFGHPRVLKISVSLYDLKEPRQVTLDLFAPHQPEKEQRHTALSFSMDGINKKYGAHTVGLGFHPKTSAGHVGTKIAFNRIPDKAEFYE